MSSERVDRISDQAEAVAESGPNRSHESQSRSRKPKQDEAGDDGDRSGAGQSSSRSKEHRRSRKKSRRNRSGSRSRSRSGRRRKRRSRSRSRRSSRSRRNRRGSPRTRGSRSRPRSHSRSRTRSRSRSRSRSHSRSRSRRQRPPPPQPNLALIQQLMAQQQASANPQITRQARRLYVGNLPIGVGLTEAVLMQFFNNAATSVGISTPSPVSSIWISSEGTFCFVEFRAVTDCTRCLTLFEGLQISGRPLRIGRPADYAPAPPHLALYVMEAPGLPPAPPECSGRMAIDFGGHAPASLSSAPQSAAGAPVAATPTEVLCLDNMVTRDDLMDDEEYADIKLDIQEECESYGKVESVVIPRPSKASEADDAAGTGRIWVRFERADQCETALLKLRGRMFNERKVRATYYSVEKFDKGEFSS